MRRLKLCDSDRERYGGPEWLDTDAAIVWLSDLDEPRLTAIEKQVQAEFGITLLEFAAKALLDPVPTMAELRGRTWLAMLAADVDITLADYAIKPMKVTREPKDTDAVPPANGADSSPSPDTTKAGSRKPSRPSSRSTAASTRGSAKPSK